VLVMKDATRGDAHLGERKQVIVYAKHGLTC
jgi:hypothetical protein